MPDFGALKTIDLRKIWPHEASAFTPWLAANIDRLGAALGLELELVTAEADVGDFSLDLLAKDLGTGRNVIVENQLTQTDHDHLGKLLTYAAGFDATAVVWVAQAIRDEHRQALEWLNQRTDTDTHFFGVVIEVLQIDDSKPAFNFKPIVLPNDWTKKPPPKPGKQTSGKSEAYRAFFQALIDELREKHRFTSARAGQPQNWYSFASGLSGVVYGASFAMGRRVRADLYIDMGDAGENKALFDALHLQRAEIEAAYGGPLEWERLDDKQACRVADYFDGSIEATPTELAQVREMLIQRLLRLKKAIGPRLQKQVVAAAAG
jgi:hypothetical protein